MLHIVENEKATRDLIASLATSRIIAATPYESGEDFLAAMYRKQTLDPRGECVLLNSNASAMTGTAFNDLFFLREWKHRIPAIFLTGHGDIRLAVELVKRGAFDLFEKPFNGDKLMDRVEDALSASRQSRLVGLTVREREVLDLILAGHMNKVIGEKLGISKRTVEVHRAHIFDKAQVKNAIELASLFARN